MHVSHDKQEMWLEVDIRVSQVMLKNSGNTDMVYLLKETRLNIWHLGAKLWRGFLINRNEWTMAVLPVVCIPYRVLLQLSRELLGTTDGPACVQLLFGDGSFPTSGRTWVLVGKLLGASEPLKHPRTSFSICCLWQHSTLKKKEKRKTSPIT